MNDELLICRILICFLLSVAINCWYENESGL
ncbi:hypothetical protein V6Z12_A11G371600 [Gossypium hirsutum]